MAEALPPREQSTTSALAQLRLATLSATVAVRSLGPVPWLLGAGYVTVAFAQEPELLRASSIFLGPQSIHSVSVALLLLLGSQLRLVRRSLTHMLAALLLALVIALAHRLSVEVGEWATGGPFARAAPTPSILEESIRYLPVIVCASLVDRVTSLWSISHCLLQIGLAVSAAPAPGWSTNYAVARIACCAAAWAATSGRCKQLA
ncbi:MAG: hypothetical protein WAT39_20330 [Planctomycetota bacterium]